MAKEKLADRMTRAGRAFELVVLRKKSLRHAADTLGCSFETVRRDVKAYSQHLADQRRSETIEERRAAMLADLDEVHRLALELYDEYKDKKPLVASAALNTMVSIQTHRRAITGADTPKEVKQDVDQLVRVVWGEDDEDDATQHQYPED